MRANYHTHCDFCDGTATAADMARAARAAGYAVLGFSSHAPLGPTDSWTMPAGRLPAYLDAINALKRDWAPGGLEAKASGPMEILLGLEIDWLPGRSSPGDAAWDALGLDYRLGSVHYAEAAPGHLYTVDCSEAHFEEFTKAAIAAGGGARELCLDYYRRLGDLAERGGFDILGHFDLVKKNNGGSRWFDEAATWYLDAAFAACARVADSARVAGRPCVVEINLGGIARGKTKEPYPSLPILAELRRLGVPVTFCADAHAPGHLGACLDTARDWAARAGYDSIQVLSRGVWLQTPLSET